MFIVLYHFFRPVFHVFNKCVSGTNCVSGAVLGIECRGPQERLGPVLKKPAL